MSRGGTSTATSLRVDHRLPPAARPGTRWALAALTWTVVLGMLWSLVPTGHSVTTTALPDGTQIVERSRESLLQSEGPGVVIVLAVPVLLAAIAVTVRRTRHARRVRFAMGGLLLAGCMLGAASVGLPYVPSAALLFAAGATTPSAPRVTG